MGSSTVITIIMLAIIIILLLDNNNYPFRHYCSSNLGFHNISLS